MIWIKVLYKLVKISEDAGRLCHSIHPSCSFKQEKNGKKILVRDHIECSPFRNIVGVVSIHFFAASVEDVASVSNSKVSARRELLR